jgi:hypothetical protein
VGIAKSSVVLRDRKVYIIYNHLASSPNSGRLGVIMSDNNLEIVAKFILAAEVEKRIKCAVLLSLLDERNRVREEERRH